MFKLKSKYIAVLEPDSQVGFKAYIEEMPEIQAKGKKIAELRENLLTQIASKLQKDKKQIHLITSIRVAV